MIANSYIVAFKQQDSVSENHEKKHESFGDQFKKFFPDFYDKAMSKSTILETRFLGSINLLPFKQKSNSNKNGLLTPIVPKVENFGVKTAQKSAFTNVVFSSNEEAVELLKEWKSNDLIWTAEPEYKSKLAHNYSDYATNNELQKKYLDSNTTSSINLHEAYIGLSDLAEGPDGNPDINNIAPIIAVFDSGTDINHPGISESLWVNPSPNVLGCGNDVHGCNTTTSFRDKIGDGNVSPAGTDESYDGNNNCTSEGGTGDCDHGTHVAGIIAGDPLRGALAVCLTCKIMTIKIVEKAEDSTSGSIRDRSIISGLNYIRQFESDSTQGSKIRVANMSFGKFSASKAVAAYVRALHDTYDVSLVAASGNEDTNRFNYPAGYPEVIAVSAVDTTQGSAPNQYPKTVFSNFGAWVEIAAPGYRINSILSGGSSGAKNGTSQATPFISGVIGLMNARKRIIKPDEVRQFLLNTADSEIYQNAINFSYGIADPSSPSPLLGKGLVDAFAAIDFKTAGEAPSFLENDRVKSMCGVVSSDSHKGNNFLVLMIMVMPFILGCVVALTAKKTEG